MYTKNIFRCVISCLFAALLSACGGGGGGGTGTPTYTIGGNLSGLAAGQTITLQNNGADDLIVSADGPFTFATSLADQTSYDITVMSQPLGQQCTVSNRSGTTAAANVTSVDVQCIQTYTIGGNLSGLAAGQTITLQNNGADDLIVSADGPFTFATRIADQTSYDVTVMSQPLGQQCTVSNRSGTTAAANVTSVDVQCIPTYTIGGNLNGLAAGQAITLQNNGTDDLIVSADGPFTFAVSLADQTGYDVTLKNAPFGQQCVVSNGSGTTAAADVTSVTVQCSDVAVLDARPMNSEVTLSWSNNGAASYDLFYSTDANCDISNIGGCAGGTALTNVTSPTTVSALTNGQHYSFWLRANLASGATMLSSSGARPDQLTTDIAAKSFTGSASGTVYMGGGFSQVGARSGGGVVLHTDSIGTRPFPAVSGEVVAVVADGGGGWYIGGDFTQVGGVARDNLAHILADGTLDTAWNPGADDRVQTLVVSGTTLYVGGLFTLLGGQPRDYLAAIDIDSSGASYGSVTAWNPGTDRNVTAFAVSDTTLYVGGSFSTVGGQSRMHLAAIDIDSSSASYGSVTAWNPGASGDVYTVTVSGTTLYVGGNFSVVGGQSRRNLAAVDIDSRSASYGSVTALNPRPSGYVYALTASGTTLYVAGSFSSIGGQTRKYLAAVDIDSNSASYGSVTAWNPGADSYVYALAASGTTLYAGGYFTTIAGQPRHRLAAFDTVSGSVTAWAPRGGGNVEALAASDHALYVGGYFFTVNGQSRSHLAAFDSSGNLTDWNPGSDLYVNDLLVSGTTLYVAGGFTTIGGQSRKNLAAIDIDSSSASYGSVTTWDPSVGGRVNTLAVSGTTLYLGGYFFTVGDQYRTHIAAVDIDSNSASYGSVTAWNPDANGEVSTLAVSGTTLYTGGKFSTIDGQTRHYLAAFDIDSSSASYGSVTAWNPNAGSTVYAITASGTNVYVGGNFTSIGGQPRKYLAALDSTTGSVSAWDPAPNYVVLALAVSGTTLYVGGGFTTISGQAHRGPAAFDTSTNTLTSWGDNVDGYVNAIDVVGSSVYLGGYFYTINGELGCPIVSLPQQ